MSVPYREVELKELVFKDEPLAFDIETIGLYGKIRLAQFYQADWPEVLLVNNPNPFELAAVIAKQHLIIQNASYEISCIQAAINGFYEPDNYDDTFYLARLKYYTKPSFALDDIMDYVLGYDPYVAEGIDKAVMQKSNWNIPVLTEQQKTYAALDVWKLLDVWEATKEHIEDTSYKLDMLAISYAVKFQTVGMPVLGDVVQDTYAKNLVTIAELAVPINVNSWKQVRPYIGHNESDALALATLAIGGNERADAVNKTRKLLKQNSFLAKFDVPEGRIYGKFLPSARSGRFTCKDQNLQQLPRLTKHCFGYDTDDGRVLVYADYAQLEMRCIAAITGDQAMERLLRAQEDLHDYTAVSLFGKEFTKEQRDIAKTANFNLLYGGGANMLRGILIQKAGIMLSEEECAAIKRKWRNLYVTVAKWQDRGIADQRRGLSWQTPFGRRYTAKLMTDQLNIINQGFGSEVAKLAMHYMEPKIEGDVGMANFVHDAFIYDCPNEPEIYERVAETVADSMQKAWFETCRTGIDLKVRDLPMPVAVFVGYNWGRIEKDYLYKLTLEGMKHCEI